MQKIIDFHAHIYSDAVAARAVSGIERFYGIPDCRGNGTVEELLALAKKHNVEAVVCHAVATSVHQVCKINDFVAGEAAKHAEIVPFMTLHPEMTAAEITAEIERARTLGCVGLKLHPDFQHFALDGKDCFKILERVSPDIPVLFHTGDRRYDFSHPRQMAVAAKAFPHLTMIAAHMGGYSEWSDVEVYLGTPNVKMDTSSALKFMSPEHAVGIIRELGVERFMFGTDYPMWSYDDELERFNRLPLSEEERNAILYGNAKSLLDKFKCARHGNN